MLRIYHNPRCSKSRAALAHMQEAGLAPEVIKYLDTPPQRQQLHTLIAKLDVPASELLREPRADGATDDEAVIEALLESPQLLQRPIIEDETRAIIARPPERAAEFHD